MKYIALFIYYSFIQYLPMQPFPGSQIFSRIRFFFVKRIVSNIGENVVIKRKSYFGDGSQIVVGNNSQLGQNSRLNGPIRIGSYVMMGPDVIMMAVTHDISDHTKYMIDPTNPSIEKQIIIGDNVWIGTRVIILPGVEIGNNCIIGSGAVVTKSFPNNCVIGGVPAKILKLRK